MACVQEFECKKFLAGGKNSHRNLKNHSSTVRVPRSPDGETLRCETNDGQVFPRRFRLGADRGLVPRFNGKKVHGLSRVARAIVGIRRRAVGAIPLVVGLHRWPCGNTKEAVRAGH